MTAPRWLRWPFIKLARVRFGIALMVMVAYVFESPNTLLALNIWLMVAVVGQFIGQFIADELRSHWEDHKVFYPYHVVRHILFFNTLCLWLALYWANRWPVWLITGLAVYELFLTLRHVLDKDFWQSGALTPSRPN